MNARHESSNLDILRSVAVLSVVACHLCLFLWENHYLRLDNVLGTEAREIGRWGVLMFFVHTSLVLMFSLERQQLRYSEKPLLLVFLTRRIFRIFPLSVFIVLFVWRLSLPVGDFQAGQFISAHLNWAGLLSNLFLLQNVFNTGSIVAVLWSLPFEMQMYFFLPALFLLAVRIRGVAPLILLWAAVVFVIHELAQIGFNYLASLVLFVPCFLPGIIAFKQTKARTLGLPSILWPITLGLIMIVYLRFGKAYICCLLLGVAVPQFRDVANPWVRKVAEIIARYSYGVYLTHLIFLWLAFQALHGLPNWTRWIIMALTTAGAPYLLYHGLEKPMIRYGERLVAEVYSLRRTSIGSTNVSAGLCTESDPVVKM
jgi:peptidoglycan/LPS O-acetylase OafA/YrhL